MYQEPNESLIQCIEEVKQCGEPIQEALLALYNLYDWCPRADKATVATGIYNIIMEYE